MGLRETGVSNLPLPHSSLPAPLPHTPAPGEALIESLPGAEREEKLREIEEEEKWFGGLVYPWDRLHQPDSSWYSGEEEEQEVENEGAVSDGEESEEEEVVNGRPFYVVVGAHQR
ncbi:hypothetical protein HK104_001958 [Borealophlyctis nickersoniae]|nr:hypothetical protein HK104_001958 [Borealophlyctis nickersoniae]